MLQNRINLVKQLSAACQTLKDCQPNLERTKPEVTHTMNQIIKHLEKTILDFKIEPQNIQV